MPSTAKTSSKLRQKHAGAGGAEHVVERGAAGVAAWPEPLEDLQPVQDGQAVLGGVEVGEGQVGELVGGEHPVLLEQLAQPEVTSGQSCGQVGEPLAGGVWSSGGTGSHGAAGAGGAASGGMRASAAEQERNGAPVGDPPGGGMGGVCCGFGPIGVSGSKPEADTEADTEAEWADPQPTKQRPAIFDDQLVSPPRLRLAGPPNRPRSGRRAAAPPTRHQDLPRPEGVRRRER